MTGGCSGALSVTAAWLGVVNSEMECRWGGCGRDTKHIPAVDILAAMTRLRSLSLAKLSFLPSASDGSAPSTRRHVKHCPSPPFTCPSSLCAKFRPANASSNPAEKQHIEATTFALSPVQTFVKVSYRSPHVAGPLIHLGTFHSSPFCPPGLQGPFRTFSSERNDGKLHSGWGTTLRTTPRRGRRGTRPGAGRERDSLSLPIARFSLVPHQPGL